MRSKSAFFALSLYAGLIPGAAFAGPNAPSGVTPENVPAASLAPNQGHALCTAAINSDGSIATRLAGSFIDSAHTFRISTGQYQVAFLAPCGNVQAVNGWFHSVQVDTLTTGAVGPTICTTADRAGVTNAVFVICYCTPFTTGSFATQCNTPFELTVSR
jgi:hypothetical protein